MSANNNSRKIRYVFYVVMAATITLSIYFFISKITYVKTDFVSGSPNIVSFIYNIVTTTRLSGAWTSFDRDLYVSNDPRGAFQYPNSRHKISPDAGIGSGSGCLQVIWKTDYEATVQYCLDEGTYLGTKEFMFNGNKITLHFERSKLCEPRNVSVMGYRLGRKARCQYYFPPSDTLSSPSSE